MIPHQMTPHQILVSLYQDLRAEKDKQEKNPSSDTHNQIVFIERKIAQYKALANQTQIGESSK